MNVGSNIRRIRQNARLSQEELAEAAGINRTYLSQLENGHSSPTLDVLERIARALDVPISALIADSRAAHEPQPLYETASDEIIYPGLREFLEDERARLLMNPSPDEIALLKSIRFLNRFSPSKDLFIEVLLDYRRRRSETSELTRTGQNDS
jgi:transcriptional regulator with XRE-family HTH domain